jgi:cell division protease FtsH
LQFLETEISEYRNYSDVTASLIDAEIKTLVEEGESRAREILTTHRPMLEKLAGILQEKEVINREEVAALMGK